MTQWSIDLRMDHYRIWAFWMFGPYSPHITNGLACSAIEIMALEELALMGKE